MRARTIADRLSLGAVNVEIHFILNRHAHYREDVPYHVHLVSDTPTRSTEEVNHILDAVRPDVVIFDCSGRAAQLKKAKQLGAYTIFISQHRRKRSKGLTLRRLRYTDEHWVVQPDVIMDEPCWLDRMKLKMLHKQPPVNIGAVFDDSAISGDTGAEWPVNLAGIEEYILFSAGGGGYTVGRQPATDVFYEVARQIHARTGKHTVVILGGNYNGELAVCEGVSCVRGLKNNLFIRLLHGAKLAVLAGGDVLTQAITLQVPTVACALVADQRTRVRKLSKAGLVLESEPASEQLQNAVQQVLEDDARLAAVSGKLRQLRLQSGLHYAVGRIADIMQSRV